MDSEEDGWGPRNAVENWLPVKGWAVPETHGVDDVPEGIAFKTLASSKKQQSALSTARQKSNRQIIDYKNLVSNFVLVIPFAFWLTV